MSEISISIEKFKVKDGFPTITYSQTQNEVSARYEVSFNNIIHGDLSQAIDRLTIHLCLITELVSELILIEFGNLQMALNGDSIYEHAAFMSFRCTGFSLSSEGVVLTGRKTLASKKVLNLVSPFALLNEDSDYLYADHLTNELEAVQAEIRLLLGGKFGGQQLNLFEEEKAA